MLANAHSVVTIMTDVVAANNFNYVRRRNEHDTSTIAFQFNGDIDLTKIITKFRNQGYTNNISYFTNYVRIKTHGLKKDHQLSFNAKVAKMSKSLTSLDIKMKPFLKWAGSKQKIMPQIISALPSGKRLVEPFVGSGAVFLNTDYESYIVGDINIDLINLYTTLKTEGQPFIDYCKTFFVDGNDRIVYNKNRDIFNTTNNVREKSALFVYLNRHCFNGLCRYNSKGGFNVPFGKYNTIYFPEKEMLEFHKKSQKVEFIHSDFSNIMNMAEKDDVVYCDPPYLPLSSTSNFKDYAPDAFGMNKQEQLATMAEQLMNNCIPVVISNHDTETARQLYHNANMVSIDVRRTISANGNRDKVKEVIAIFNK